jgi:hypothetical protein
MKGRLILQDGGEKIIQGVRELFEIMDLEPAQDQDDKAGSRTGKLVIIGRHLDDYDFKGSILAALR